MRKFILFIATSLDGYIAGPNGERDDHATFNSKECHAFGTGLVRLTYER
ncbi:MAG: hypothetical protein AABM64_09670 [Pseudomonadota bacterium]